MSNYNILLNIHVLNEVLSNNKPFIIPELIIVDCNGKEADYVTNNHLILYECSECENGKSMRSMGKTLRL
jgi:hypothetical protein